MHFMHLMLRCSFAVYRLSQEMTLLVRLSTPLIVPFFYIRPVYFNYRCIPKCTFYDKSIIFIF